jgi:hypothetical protein
MTLRDLYYDFCDHDAVYFTTMVWPARYAAATMVEWSSMLANAALAVGLKRLAAGAAVYGYDIADHDPDDACWELHRQRVPWAYLWGSFRPYTALLISR